MFKVNDKVVYGTHGVCKIAEITNKTVGKCTMNYYVLKPIYQENQTLYVPTEY